MSIDVVSTSARAATVAEPAQFANTSTSSMKVRVVSPVAARLRFAGPFEAVDLVDSDYPLIANVPEVFHLDVNRAIHVGSLTDDVSIDFAVINVHGGGSSVTVVSGSEGGGPSGPAEWDSIEGKPAGIDEVSQDVDVTLDVPARQVGTIDVGGRATLLSSLGVTNAHSPMTVYAYNGIGFSPPPIGTGSFEFDNVAGLTIGNLIDGLNGAQNFATADLDGSGHLRFTQSATNSVITLAFSASGDAVAGCSELGFANVFTQTTAIGASTEMGRTVLVQAEHVAVGDTNVAAAIAALSPPEGPWYMIDEMRRGSREPYSRFPLLPAGVAVVNPGDLVVNAMPVIKSTSFPDVSAASPAGMTFAFKDYVGRTDDNSPIDFVFTTTGATVSLLDRISQLNAALAAAGVALVVIAQPGSFDVVAAYGKWSGVFDASEGRAVISGTLADELGLSGPLMPTRTAYMDETTFQQVRFNGGYRSWSKVSLFSDGGGIYRNGELFLPDLDHTWITFGVAVERPGVPGELDIVARNATIIGNAVTPNMMMSFADPVREYIDPRGLTFVAA